VTSTSAAKKTVLQAIEAVAGVLGNTRAVCRKSYIHPRVIDTYLTDGHAAPDGAATRRRVLRAVPRGLRPDEVAALAIVAAPMSGRSGRRVRRASRPRAA
jgi:DNA topoisomerase-1